MRVVLAGAERGQYRGILLSNKVKRVALNLSQFSVPTTKELILSDKFPGQDLYLYTSESDDDEHSYDQFLREHHDDLTMVIGMPGYDGTWLGEKYVPIWNDKEDLERLAYLCEKVGRVAISDQAINKTTLTRIRQLKQRWGTTMVAITSKTDVLEQIEWDYALVGSWKSVVRYGETQLWDGHGLRRFPAQQKETARRKHRAAIARLGVDFDAVMADEVEAVSKLAIRSWLEWEMVKFHGESNAYDPLGMNTPEDDDDTEAPQVATTQGKTALEAFQQMGGGSIANIPPTTRNSDERALLPVLGLETALPDRGNGDETPGNGSETGKKEDLTVTYKGGKLRNCDNCFLAPRCPAMTPGAECAYDIPVELKTKTQLMALIRAMLEIQGNRVMFSTFAEELEGQGLDPQLSKEMDRMMDMITKFKDISDTRDVVRVEVEARGSAGVLSRIFGDKAGERAQSLSEPVNSNHAAELLAGMSPEVIDAEVVEDSQQG
jgi:hypothetical protein